MTNKETLEEASIRLVPNRTLKTPFGSPYEITPTRERNTFKKGAKWQSERLYSEKDLRNAYFSGIKTTGEGWNGEYAGSNDPNVEETFEEGFQEWLKQFKNK